MMSTNSIPRPDGPPCMCKVAILGNSDGEEIDVDRTLNLKDPLFHGHTFHTHWKLIIITLETDQSDARTRGGTIPQIYES